MGICCTKAAQVAYSYEKYVNEDAWLQWDKHEARNHYTVERVLGRGAFSEVVAAISKDTGRRVALKVVFLDNPGLKKQQAEILQAEVNIMQKLQHPNIVSFEAIIIDNVRKQLVIAEEILLGGTLTDELLHGTNCNNDRLVAHIFKQIFSAVEHTHSKGIVHRDIKPENIMFRAPASRWLKVGAVPVLIDFGMSQELRASGPPVKGLLGSPGFVAPEVIEGEAHTPALDMFALGVMLYITITGRRPMTNRQANTLTYNSFEAWDYPHMHSDSLWLATNSSERDIVLSLLERDPSKRLTAAEALQHPWVTADMRVHRPLAARSSAFAVQAEKAQDAVLAEKRCRLSQERHQGHVEEMLRYMVLALKARHLQGAAARGLSEIHGPGHSFSSSVLVNGSGGPSDIHVHMPDTLAALSANPSSAEYPLNDGTTSLPEDYKPAACDAAAAAAAAGTLHDTFHGTLQGLPSPRSAAAGVQSPPTASAPVARALQALRRAAVNRSLSDITHDSLTVKAVQLTNAATAAASKSKSNSNSKERVNQPQEDGASKSDDDAEGPDDSVKAPSLTAQDPVSGQLVEEALRKHVHLLNMTLNGSSHNPGPAAPPSCGPSPTPPLHSPHNPFQSPAAACRQQHTSQQRRAGLASPAAAPTTSQQPPQEPSDSSGLCSDSDSEPEAPHAADAEAPQHQPPVQPPLDLSPVQPPLGPSPIQPPLELAPVQPPLDLPTLGDTESSTLPVERFPLMQGQGDRLFEVVTNVRAQACAGKQHQKRASSLFAPSRTPSHRSSLLHPHAEEPTAPAPSSCRASPRARDVVTSRLSASSFGFGFGARSSQSESARVPLLGGSNSGPAAGGRASVAASVASATSATEVEVSGLVGLWGAAGADAAGDQNDLYDVRAVAQVQWGLRRWRQLAGRLGRGGSGAPAHSAASHSSQAAATFETDAADEAGDVMIADLIPSGMHEAQIAAERALRIGASLPNCSRARGSYGQSSAVGSSSTVATGVNSRSNSVCAHPMSPRAGAAQHLPPTAPPPSQARCSSSVPSTPEQGALSAMNSHAALRSPSCASGSQMGAPPRLLTTAALKSPADRETHI